MDRDAFFRFCQANRELGIERDAEGDIIIMAPTGTETGGRNAALTAQLYIWSKKDGSGKSFDSNTGFELPNGATRSPDAAWMSMDKWSALSPEERHGFARVCPEFVIELRSPSDRLDTLQAKMEEYLENGARLGFLIDPVEQVAVVYRPGRSPERLSHPAMLSAAPEMPGLSLDLDDVW
jgi:Uma2 family endonuclease